MTARRAYIQTTGTIAMPPALKQPQSQVYLIHGNNEAEVGNARFELVSGLLTPEERDSGLTEITGPGNQPLTLNRAFSEIVGELGTSSFIAGSKRVVVVYDLKEFYNTPGGGGAAKKGAKESTKKPAASPVEPFLRWLTDVLPTTENVVVFVCQENDEKQRVVSPHAELYRFCKSKGVVVEKRDKPMQFEFDNHLLSGNMVAALTTFREWVRRSGGDGGARSKMFSTLSGFVELLLQARALQEARTQGVPATQIAVQAGFPSLGSVPDWKAKKIHQIAERTPMDRLLELVRGVNRLQAIMYPTGDEDYVPNWEEAYELLIVQITQTRAR